MLRAYILQLNTDGEVNRSILFQDKKRERVLLDHITPIEEGTPVISDVGDYWSDRYLDRSKVLHAEV